MVRTFQIALLALLLSTSSLFAVTASGTVLLQDQQNHSGSRIIFTASSPSAETDTAYSEVSGFYSLDLAIGIYDIEFSHEGFVPVTWNDVAILEGQTIETIYLITSENALIDTVTGTLNGTYYVVGNLIVPQDSSLNIFAGTELRFMGPYQILVEGSLHAIGTEQDSIIFTSLGPSDSSSWRGIYFSESSNNSELEYCLIEKSISGGIETRASLTAFHILFLNNHGGGLVCNSTIDSVIVSNCIFRGNIAGGGGGILSNYSSIRVSSCLIENNYAEGSGGGFNSNGGGVLLTDCQIRNNFALQEGGGISLYEGFATIMRCTIANNEAQGFFGAAIRCYTTNTIISNCTLVGNLGIGIDVATNNALIDNTIVAFSTRSALKFWNYNDPAGIQVSYCDLFDNSEGNIMNPEYGPPYLCQLVTRNSRLDSSDVYLNVQVDPLFVNPANGDYHLQFESHLINAGDPDSPLDPDGTIADIGAYYFDLGTGIDPQGFPVPQSYVSLSNYPNPFNPVTHLNFDLTETGTVSLDIYDLSGRIVGTLVNKSVMTEGSHEFTWNAESFPSGSYFAKLVTPNQTAVHRIVLLK